MKPSLVVLASAVSAASVPSAPVDKRNGLGLELFGKVNTITQEEAEAQKDVIDLKNRQLEIQADILGIHIDLTIGSELLGFGNLSSITTEDAAKRLDLGGNDFSKLPVSTMDKEKRDTGDCPNPNIRFEWDNYSSSDKQAFVDAFKCLMDKPPSGQWAPSRSRYEDIVRVHQSYAPNIHSQSTSVQTHKFLLWHRYYVWALEQIMRDECGFNRAFPWWDEKKWAGRFAQASIFTNQYFGTLPGPTNGQGTCITNGKFAGLTCSLGPGQATNNPHCLQRAVNEQATAQTGQNAWNTCFQRQNYPDFHSCVEFTYHGQGHNGVGAIMADAIASPSDPVFFMHHLFVDYAFRKWQNEDISRRTSISGCAANGGCPPLTLDTMVYMGNLCGAKCPDLRVRDLLNTLNGHMCYRYDY